MSKVINRNTVKISYKCMPNMKKAIGRHNNNVLKKQDEEQNRKGSIKISIKQLLLRTLTKRIVIYSSIIYVDGLTFILVKISKPKVYLK